MEFTGRLDTDGARPVAAVVYNPMKMQQSVIRMQILDAARHHGWAPPQFFQTDEHDCGVGATKRALASGAERIIAYGGDGTIRAVCAAMTNTDVPVALIPTGTGNLLARNLSVPLGFNGALKTAFTGQPRTVDTGTVAVDGADPVTFVGMAGIGFDALMMGDATVSLKKWTGPIAYVLSFFKRLGTRPVRIRTRVDHKPIHDTKAVLMMVGNVPSLQAGVHLFPYATPDDGILDLLVATPEDPVGWMKVAAAIVRRRRASEVVSIIGGRHIEIHLNHEMPWEVDGDVMGEGRRFVFVVDPASLKVIAG